MKKSILLSTMALGCLIGWSANGWAFCENTPVSGWAFFTQTMLLEHDVKRLTPTCMTEGSCPGCSTVPLCCANIGYKNATLMDFAPKPGFLTMWIDPGMTLATAADAAVTYFQHKKSIKMDDALEDLQKYLEAADSQSAKDQESSLAAKEMDLLAPELVIGTLQDDSSSFEDIRSAVISETLQTGTCNDACAAEKASTWLLLSVELARAIADKVVAYTDNMTERFQQMADDFNRLTPIPLHQNSDQTGTDDAFQALDESLSATSVRNVENSGQNDPNAQNVSAREIGVGESCGSGEKLSEQKDENGNVTKRICYQSNESSSDKEKRTKDKNTQSPKMMWGHMSEITLDTLTQVNDLNVMYARDLEMHGLAGIYESGTEVKHHPGSSS